MLLMPFRPLSKANFYNFWSFYAKSFIFLVHTRSEVSVKEAIPSDGAPTEDYNIGRYIGSGLFDSSSGHFTHPEAGQKQMSLKELIVKGYLNPYGTRILDTKSGKELNLLDAIDEHIVVYNLHNSYAII